MSAYIPTSRLIVRTLYHFALFPYVVFGLASPIIIYLLLKAGVDIQGNILKLYSEMGVQSDIEIYAFSAFLVFALFLPIIAMTVVYRRFGRFGQLSFVISIYLLIPAFAYLFFTLIS